MNVDLEALCKTYLMFHDSEFCARLDSEAEYHEKEQKFMALRSGLSEVEAEDFAKTYRAGMMDGCLMITGELMRMISIELGNEIREFEKSRGYLCPNCDNTSLLSKSDDVPVLYGSFVTSYVCPKCGFSREFPKAILARDIFTEYAKEKEKEEEE